MDDIIRDVLQEEQACQARIEAAQRQCSERIERRRQALAAERAALQAQLEAAHARELAAEREACRRDSAAGLAAERSLLGDVAQNAALCAAIEDRIIDSILEL